MITDAQLTEMEALSQGVCADMKGTPQNCMRDLIAEVRRLREVIKKRNHCVDCGKLNPIDNVCDECLEEYLR